MHGTLDLPRFPPRSVTPQARERRRCRARAGAQCQRRSRDSKETNVEIVRRDPGPEEETKPGKFEQNPCGNHQHAMTIRACQTVAQRAGAPWSARSSPFSRLMLFPRGPARTQLRDLLVGCDLICLAVGRRFGLDLLLYARQDPLPVCLQSSSFFSAALVLQFRSFL